MAKLTLAFLAVFALSLVLASSSFRATITIDEEAGNQPGQSCREQMQQQQMLNQCQMYLQQQQRRRGSRDNQEERQRLCCEQLRKMDTQCRCPAIREMIEQEMGEMEREREMMETAENLPAICRLQPMRCQFSYATPAMA